MARCEQTGGSENEADSPIFRAKLVVRPDQAADCAVLDSDTDAAVVAHELKVPPSCAEPGDPCNLRACGECHVELTTGSGTYVRARPADACVCPVLKRHDCLTRLEAVRSGALIVTVTTPQRATLFTLIEDLRDTGATVSIGWLTAVDGDGKTIEVDSDVITATQRETLEAAIEAGYYEDGGATLADLAAELDLSESAISQRLNAAETRLVKAFLSESNR